MFDPEYLLGDGKCDECDDDDDDDDDDTLVMCLFLYCS